MADQTIIPPVSGNRPIPKSRPVPAKEERQKRRQTPERRPDKKDNGRPSIDEYA